MIEKRKKIVIFILGTDRSGSTALDMELGSYNNVTSLGEVFWLSRYIEEGKNCHCGEPLINCSMWSSVITNNIPFSITVPFGWKKRLQYLLTKDIGIDKKKFIDANLNIYRSIFKAQDTNIIIDSSKDPTRASILSSSNEFDFVLLYIRRPLKDYLKSIKKSKQYGRIKEKKKGIPEAIIKWSGRNVECLIYSLFSKKNTIFTSYNKLNDTSEMNRIKSIALNDASGHRMRKSNPSFHTLGGNEAKNNFEKFEFKE